jgi:transcription-repair coupling factor (superfamily II helicase)
VGRGINQAYAYFLFDRKRQLTHQARERLRTIFEAAELGAGFSIAMKDLEIRGAGNLLGVRQSGYIAAIGFDLYSQLLAEAVAELKAGENVAIGEKQPRGEEVTGHSPAISLPLDAYIPEEYVADLDARLSLYRRLAGIKSVAEVTDMAQELEDRFGSPPPPVKNLLYVVEIKALAARAGVESISTSGSRVTVKLGGGREVKGLPRHGGYGGAVRVGHTQLKLDIKRSGSGWTAALKEMLQDLAAVTAAPSR